MTTTYQCDRCGIVMSFEEVKICCLEMGGEPIQKDDIETRKRADLCPNCWPVVDEYIKGSTQLKHPVDEMIYCGDLDAMAKILKQKGYVIYKKSK